MSKKVAVKGNFKPSVLWQLRFSLLSF